MRKPIWIALVVITALAIGGYVYRAATFRPMRNFHVVDDGRFYRSAQPTADELDELVHRYGIKTVINLRGSQPGEWWYDDEARELKTLGVTLVNLGFSTENVQNRQDWLDYLHTLDTAERPILVHCRSGADRTSETSAIYAIEFMGKSKEAALNEQMSLSDLYVQLFQPAKRLFVENYQGREWLKTYDPCANDFRKYARVACPPN